jgi:7-alpha-hydroxysteroid dehydrogenase
MSNRGKVVVITGATKGIGAAIARKFASEGVNVAFTYNSSKEKAEALAIEWSEEFGIKAVAYPLNILEPDEFKPLFGAIDQDFDRVDFFVSNAMIYGRPVVGGYGKFMRLKPRGLNNIYTAKL